MISATLDTNVLISGILFDGTPRKVIQRAIRGQFILMLSPAILDEMAAVLQRPKFGFPAEFVQIVVRELEGIATIIYPTTHRTVVHRDPKDNIIVECAIDADSDFIVTGDNHLLSLPTVERVSIVTPADFMNRLPAE